MTHEKGFPSPGKKKAVPGGNVILHQIRTAATARRQQAPQQCKDGEMDMAQEKTRDAAMLFRTALARLVKEKGHGYQGVLSAKAGFKQAYVSNIMRGHTAGSDEARTRIAEAMGLQYEEMLALGRRLLGDAERQGGAILCGDAKPPLDYAPILTWAQAKEMAMGVLIMEGAAPKVRITVAERCPNAFVLPVRGESMEPEFAEGDLIVVDPDRSPWNGCYVVALVTIDDEPTLKRFVVDAGRTYLSPDNSRYPVIDVTDLTLIIIGVVVEKSKHYFEEGRS